MRIGSLFSGIGGLELGLEWAGVGETAWQVEQDQYCQGVLAKHWPEAQRYDDVRTVGAHNLAPVDVICGGFPCQDISYAGDGAGIAEGTRSGLWFEFARIIGELRPRWVVVENVVALERRGLPIVLGDLRSLGYRGERLRISAAGVGAPHLRWRLFVVAYADGGRGRSDVTGGNDANGANAGRAEANRLSGAVCDSGGAEALANPAGLGWREGRAESTGFFGESGTLSGGASVAHSESERREREAGRPRGPRPAHALGGHRRSTAPERDRGEAEDQSFQQAHDLGPSGNHCAEERMSDDAKDPAGFEDVPVDTYPRWKSHTECESPRFTMESFMRGIEAMKNYAPPAPCIILSQRQDAIRRRKIAAGMHPYTAAIEAQCE